MAVRKLAQVSGGIWMALCAALWLWVGLSGPNCAGFPFTTPRLLCESRFGLTFLPILLAIPGAGLWAWGRRGR
jgi:hypothetical protein